MVCLDEVTNQPFLKMCSLFPTNVKERYIVTRNRTNVWAVKGRENLMTCMCQRIKS